MSSIPFDVVDLLIRVTLLLGAGSVVALALHRRSASVGHLAWSASLGGSLVLGALVPWSPRFALPVPAWPGGADVVSTSPSPTHRAQSPSPDVNPLGILPADRGDAVTVGSTEPRPIWLLIWVAGGAVVLTWGLAGRLGLTLLTRRARPVSDGPWREAVDDTRRRLGVGRPIAIFMSSHVGAPMTWGALTPVLIVPEESAAWPDGLRRSVVAHEVAHVARHDYVIQLMAMTACAFYWFHPLVWMATRRMRQAAERACDDQVLGLGTTNEEYAAHLIGVARASRALRLTGAVAIGMARPSTLEGRIVAVLDADRRRGEPPPRVRKTGVALAAAALLLIGGVRPVIVAGANVPELPAVTVPDRETDSVAVIEELVPAVLPSAALPAPQQGDSIIERTLSATRGGELRVELRTGGDVTVRGWDETTVRVRVRLSGVHWRDVAVDIERESGGVRVGSSFTRRRDSQSTSNEFEIMVPRRYDVRVSSDGGSFTLIGIEGRFTGHTGGGELVLDRLTGSARLTTGGGEILVTDSDLSGSVQTGGGMVRLSNVRGGLRGSSGSGPVVYGESTDPSRRGTTDISSVTVTGDRISVGRGTDDRVGTLSIEKAGGEVTLGTAPNGAHIRTGGGAIRVGETAGVVDAQTGGGDITIGPAAGSVRATTGAGDVRITVERSTADQVVDVSSGKGRIIIELPREWAGRLDLETAHTRTFEETARIRSDWDLQREPLTDWVNRFGTPRRFLRATAEIGRGNSRVVVRTVNGEIEIRRR